MYRIEWLPKHIYVNDNEYVYDGTMGMKIPIDKYGNFFVNCGTRYYLFNYEDTYNKLKSGEPPVELTSLTYLNRKLIDEQNNIAVKFSRSRKLMKKEMYRTIRDFLYHQIGIHLKKITNEEEDLGIEELISKEEFEETRVLEVGHVKLGIEKSKSTATKYIGKQFETKHHGIAEVVEYKTSKHVVVKFLNTGNLKVTRIYSLTTGSVADN